MDLPGIIHHHQFPRNFQPDLRKKFPRNFPVYNTPHFPVTIVRIASSDNPSACHSLVHCSSVWWRKRYRTAYSRAAAAAVVLDMVSKVSIHRRHVSIYRNMELLNYWIVELSIYLILRVINYRTFDLSMYRIIGFSTCRNIELSYFRDTELSNYRYIEIELWSVRNIESSNFRYAELSNYRTFDVS